MAAENNKKMLTDLYGAVVAKDWELVRGLLHDDFVEHNPRVPHDPAQRSGREAFVLYFQTGATPLDHAQVEIARMIADEDHAIVHYKLTNPENPRGIAVVDIFKVRDGRFIEHWDVLQPVPEHAANPHGMT